MPRFVKGESPAESNRMGEQRNKPYQLQVAEYWQNSLAAQQRPGLSPIAEEPASPQQLHKHKGNQPAKAINLHNPTPKTQNRTTATAHTSGQNPDFQSLLKNRVRNIQGPQRKQAITAILKADTTDKMQQRGVYLTPSLGIDAAPYPFQSRKPPSENKSKSLQNKETASTSSKKKVRFEPKSVSPTRKTMLGYAKANPGKATLYAGAGLLVAAAASIGIAQGIQEAKQAITDDNNASKDMARELFIERNPGEPLPDEYITTKEEPEEISWSSPWTERLSAY